MFGKKLLKINFLKNRAEALILSLFNVVVAKRRSHDHQRMQICILLAHCALFNIYLHNKLNAHAAAVMANDGGLCNWNHVQSHCRCTMSVYKYRYTRTYIFITVFVLFVTFRLLFFNFFLYLFSLFSYMYFLHLICIYFSLRVRAVATLNCIGFPWAISLNIHSYIHMYVNTNLFRTIFMQFNLFIFSLDFFLFFFFLNVNSFFYMDNTNKGLIDRFERDRNSTGVG